MQAAVAPQPVYRYAPAPPMAYPPGTQGRLPPALIAGGLVLIAVFLFHSQVGQMDMIGSDDKKAFFTYLQVGQTLIEVFAHPDVGGIDLHEFLGEDPNHPMPHPLNLEGQTFQDRFPVGLAAVEGSALRGRKGMVTALALISLDARAGRAEA